MRGYSQCQWYTVTVEDTANAFEVSWELLDENGVIQLSGGAPYEEDVCLPDGCYTLLMYDSAGNGWQDENWVIEDWLGEFDWDTNLSDGFHGNDILDLGDNGCSASGGGGTNGSICPNGTTAYNLEITSGTNPNEITWFLAVDGSQIAAGGAPYNDTLCLANGCHFLYMFDAGANGWEGATYNVTDNSGTSLLSGTMTTLISDTTLLNLGGLDCSNADPGGTVGTGCGTEPPSSDCATAPCVCDPYDFNISPSGFGVSNEIPSAGSISNPSYSPANQAPWGGTDFGCLLAGERNSSWMRFSIATSGVLEFNFGAGGQQIGYYDWEMWEYNGVTSCTQITNNTLPPARCVWNAVSWGGTGIASVIPPGGNAGNYGPPLNVTAGQEFIICFSNWSYANAAVTLDFTGTAGIDCSLLLPVEMLDFTVSYDEPEAVLRWSTASELNCDLFVVEHSIDRVHWSSIGLVQGAGTATTYQSYSYRHNHPAFGQNYYRLKQVDFNGAFEYSELREIDVNPKADILIYPNPCDEAFQLFFPPEFEQGTLTLFNSTGSKIDHWKNIEFPVQRISTERFPSGLYYLTFINSISDPQTKKIIINHK